MSGHLLADLTRDVSTHLISWSMLHRSHDSPFSTQIRELGHDLSKRQLSSISQGLPLRRLSAVRSYGESIATTFRCSNGK